MRMSWMVMALLSTLLVADVAFADPLELRRPYVQADPVSYGFDNQPGVSGCTDHECGSICYHGHGGSDFPLSMGTDVLAGADGTVTAINNSCDDWGYLGNECGGRCGNYVQLQHANGDFTIYCHMQRNSLVVSTGDTVSCGDVIGKSASSGSSTGPHLHLGWRPGGGASTDVYAGSCNNSPGAWVDQGAYGQPPSADCACQPTTEVCDGTDNNCDGTVDSGDVCEIDLLHQAPHAYTQPRTTDVDGDGLQNVCARFHSGFRCFRPTDSGWEDALTTDLMATGDGWGEPEYYSTLRVGDVTGDGRADVCARGPDGFACWRSTGDGFEEFDTIGWSDDNGWHRPQFYTTIRLADLNGNGKDDVCARGIAGWRCYLSTGDEFDERIDTDLWTDDDGFDRARYYGTIRTGDVDGSGQDDVCAREDDGFACYRFTGDGFERFAHSGGKADEHGWGNIIYWPSIRLADIDGDGTMSLCARDSSGLFCRRYDGDDFGSKLELGGLSNDSGWSDPTNYATLRAGDVTGDGSDELCIRANRGMLCYRVDGDEVTRWDGPEWSNDEGWEAHASHGPIFITNIDDAEQGALCGRSSAGLSCEVYGGDENFDLYPHFDQFTDDGGWTARQHYSSIRMGQGGTCRADWCDEEEEDGPGGDDVGVAGGDDVGIGAQWDAGGDSSGTAGTDQTETTMSTSSGCSAGSTGAVSGWWLLLIALFGLILRKLRRSARLAALCVVGASLALLGCDSASELDGEAVSTPAKAEAPGDEETLATESTPGSGFVDARDFDDYDLLAIHGDWAVFGDPVGVPKGTDGPRRFDPLLVNDGALVDWPLDQELISGSLIVGDEPTLLAVGLDHTLVSQPLDRLDDTSSKLIDDHLTSQVSPATDGCCVAYVRHGDDGQRLHVHDLERGESTETELGFSLGWAPVVAEGGERIGWTATPHGHAAVLIDEPGGDEPRAIVNADPDLTYEELDPFPKGVHTPLWTPEGIAFEGADHTLWLIDDDGDPLATADGEEGMFWDETRQKLVDRSGAPVDWRRYR